MIFVWLTGLILTVIGFIAGFWPGMSLLIITIIAGIVTTRIDKKKTKLEAENAILKAQLQNKNSGGNNA